MVRLFDPTARFSFFSRPITNIRPCANFALSDAYKYITGDLAHESTSKLRSITDVKIARDFKAANFDYVTFSGLFSKRNRKPKFPIPAYSVSISTTSKTLTKSAGYSLTMSISKPSSSSHPHQATASNGSSKSTSPKPPTSTTSTAFPII